jgi:hypothetical protein
VLWLHARDDLIDIENYRVRPLFVAAIGREQITMSFNNDPGIGEDARKLLSEVAVGEPDSAHAARE